jgi:SAM-dependent methyltransferase
MEKAPQTPGAEQATLWNGVAGRAWVELQALLDHIFKPCEDLLLQAISAGSGGRALDVGCGTGGTTLAVGRLLGAKGRSCGIDISDAMIAAARARAEQEAATVEFIRADAQSYAFEPESLDLIISRFGVMFFDDSVKAFANLRRAARNDAELLFLAWRDPAENPFMTTAERAAAPLLPNLPVREPDAPGQFAFADRNRIQLILEESGWVGIEIRQVDVLCNFPEVELVRYFTQLGPLGRVLHQADGRTRAQIVERVRTAYDPYVRATEVRFEAACWMVGARRTLPSFFTTTGESDERQ